MKTDLVIDEDLKQYLVRENNRSDELLGYDKQWVFKFENNYGASIIKHRR